MLPVLFLFDESRRVRADSRLKVENREVELDEEAEAFVELGRRGGRAGLGELDDDDDPDDLEG